MYAGSCCSDGAKLSNAGVYVLVLLQMDGVVAKDSLIKLVSLVPTRALS